MGQDVLLVWRHGHAAQLHGVQEIFRWLARDPPYHEMVSTATVGSLPKCPSTARLLRRPRAFGGAGGLPGADRPSLLRACGWPPAMCTSATSHQLVASLLRWPGSPPAALSPGNTRGKGSHGWGPTSLCLPAAVWAAADGTTCASALVNIPAPVRVDSAPSSAF